MCLNNNLGLIVFNFPMNCMRAIYCIVFLLIRLSNFESIEWFLLGEHVDVCLCLCVWDYRLCSANSHSDIIWPKEEIKMKRLSLVGCDAKRRWERMNEKKRRCRARGGRRRKIIKKNGKIIPFTEFYLSSNIFSQRFSF